MTEPKNQFMLENKNPKKKDKVKSSKLIILLVNNINQQIINHNKTRAFVWKIILIKKNNKKTEKKNYISQKTYSLNFTILVNQNISRDHMFSILFNLKW